MVAFLTVMVIMLFNLLIAFLSGAHRQVQMQAQAKVMRSCYMSLHLSLSFRPPSPSLPPLSPRVSRTGNE